MKKIMTIVALTAVLLTAGSSVMAAENIADPVWVNPLQTVNQVIQEQPIMILAKTDVKQGGCFDPRHFPKVRCLKNIRIII